MTIRRKLGKRMAARLGAAAMLAAPALAAPKIAVAATPPPASGAAPRPNIIIMMADDMGFSDIGCYGGEINTPNLNRLAKEGVRFTQFYNTARCCPTRACLLTGLYPHQAGVGHMAQDMQAGPGYVGNLSKNAVTIPEVLRTAGYETYMLGKWHVTRFERPKQPHWDWPRQRGFDHYYGIIMGASDYYDPGSLMRDNTNITPWTDPEYKPDHYYLTDALGDNAVRYIHQHTKEDAKKPFFMYVAFTSPHWPMQAPEETVAHYKGKYDKGYDPIRQARFKRQKEMGIIDSKWEPNPTVGDWAAEKDKAWEARCMEVYAAMVERMDTNIGQIVDALKKDGQLDNTLILFLSDNGGCAESMWRDGYEKLPDHPTLPPIPKDRLQLTIHPAQTRDGWPILSGRGVMPGPETSYITYGRNWANVSNTPFREYKHWVHEGGISSPLIAHWPKGISRQDALERQPGHLIDLMATCVDLSGATYPKEYQGNTIPPMEGVSLMPAFLGAPLDRKAPIFWEHEGNRAVRMGPWKLVAKGIDGAWELYNMEQDRTEMHNLAAEQPERVKAMADAWQHYAARALVLPMPWDTEKGKAAL